MCPSSSLMLVCNPGRMTCLFQNTRLRICTSWPVRAGLHFEPRGLFPLAVKHISRLNHKPFSHHTAGYLYRVVAYSDWAPVKKAIAGMGKNCHTPNSYQTPLHAVLRHTAHLGKEGPPPSAEQCQEVFRECILRAMREGGCCASRCGVIGGILGWWRRQKVGEKGGHRCHKVLQVLLSRGTDFPNYVHDTQGPTWHSFWMIRWTLCQQTGDKRRSHSRKPKNGAKQYWRPGVTHRLPNEWQAMQMPPPPFMFQLFLARLSDV
jgi:hypothetical protein